MDTFKNILVQPEDTQTVIAAVNKDIVNLAKAYVASSWNKERAPLQEVIPALVRGLREAIEAQPEHKDLIFLQLITNHNGVATDILKDEEAAKKLVQECEKVAEQGDLDMIKKHRQWGGEWGQLCEKAANKALTSETSLKTLNRNLGQGAALQKDAEKQWQIVKWALLDSPNPCVLTDPLRDTLRQAYYDVKSTDANLKAIVTKFAITRKRKSDDAADTQGSTKVSRIHAKDRDSRSNSDSDSGSDSDSECDSCAYDAAVVFTELAREIAAEQQSPSSLSHPLPLFLG